MQGVKYKVPGCHCIVSGYIVVYSKILYYNRLISSLNTVYIWLKDTGTGHEKVRSIKFENHTFFTPKNSQIWYCGRKGDIFSLLVIHGKKKSKIAYDTF